MSEKSDYSTIKADTIAALNLTEDEAQYITEELVGEPASEADIPFESAEAEDASAAAAPVPNRLTYISHVTRGFTGTRWNITFYANCNYSVRYLMWDTQINRYHERNGNCRTPMGTYVPRFMLYWRA